MRHPLRGRRSSLTIWSDAGHGGRALASGYKVRITDRRGVMPDLQFHRLGNDAAFEQQQGLVRGRPEAFEGLEIPLAKLWS